MRVAAILSAISTTVIVVFASAGAVGQQVYAYPNAGQTESQQSQDRFECHQWSVTQSGFDPSTAPPLTARPASPPPPPRSGYSDRRQRRSSGGLFGIGDGGMFQGSGLIGDAATGAALGAAGGAIAGDAGQGAAIGAVASTLFGALNRSSAQSRQPPPQQQSYNYDYYQQQQAGADREFDQREAVVAEYNRAFGACMSSRDYTVN